MKIVWSLPVRGEPLTSSRGDLVRARHLIAAMRADGHEVIVVEDATHAHTHAAVTTYRKWLRSCLPRRLMLVLRDVGRALHGCVHAIHVASVARTAQADLMIETQVAYSASGALASRLTGIPFVLDDCSPSSEERALGAGLYGLARAVLRLQGRTARTVVAVSPALADLLAVEGVPLRKIVCVPNGISPNAFDRAVAATPRRDRSLDGECVVAFVGSFQPWHQVELLIEAIAVLPDDIPVRVVLVGGGPGLAAVLERAALRRMRERVTLIGTVAADAIPALLAACDIGVLPHSNTYGDPMKLREYAAAGLPAIAPDLQPVREVVEHETTGLLFPPADVGALAGALARLVADPAMRRRLGEEARQRVLATGSWAERARALLVPADAPGI